MPSALASLLARDGVVSLPNLERAFQRQVLRGGTLDTALLELDLLEEEALVKYLSLANGLPGRAGDLDVETAAAETCTEDVAVEFEVVPERLIEGELTVLVRDNVDLSTLEALAKRLEQPLKPVVTTELRFLEAKNLLFASGLEKRFKGLAQNKPSPGSVVWKAPSVCIGSEWSAEEVAPANTNIETDRFDTEEDVPTIQEPIDDSVTPRSLKEALESATTKDEIFRAFLRELCTRTQYAAVFAIKGKNASGYLALNRGVFDDSLVKQVEIPVSESIGLARSVESASPYIGSLSTDDSTKNDDLRLLGGTIPTSALILPLVLGKRVVAIGVAHSPGVQLNTSILSGLFPVADQVSEALVQVVKRKKSSKS